MTPPDPLREAAQAIWDRIDGLFDEDDLDPESSFAMSVPMKGRDAGRLRAALAARPAADTGLREGSCGCTCCNGSWVLDAISYRCSGGCRCMARWHEGQPISEAHHAD